MTLFSLSDEIFALEASLENDDLTDEQRAALVDAWLEAQGDVAVKIDNYAAYIRELEARSIARQYEAGRLEALAKTDTNRIASLKARLKLYFEAHGLTKLETPRFKVAIQKNGGIVPLVVPPEWEAEPASAPEAFQRRVILLDKEAIREAIRNDEEAHGATLGERGSSIRIR